MKIYYILFDLLRTRRQPIDNYFINFNGSNRVLSIKEFQ